jgi:hypothetical protein
MCTPASLRIYPCLLIPTFLLSLCVFYKYFPNRTGLSHTLVGNKEFSGMNVYEF